MDTCITIAVVALIILVMLMRRSSESFFAPPPIYITTDDGVNKFVCLNTVLDADLVADLPTKAIIELPRKAPVVVAPKMVPVVAPKMVPAAPKMVPAAPKMVPVVAPKMVPVAAPKMVPAVAPTVPRVVPAADVAAAKVVVPTPPRLPRPSRRPVSPYREVCGSCLPTEADPNIWEQQCIVKNGQNYPLLYYTMTKPCMTCSDDTGVKVCQRYKQPGAVYQGEAKAMPRSTFCA